jgi:mannose-1-phosphate guanylyltransferase
MNRNNFCVIMAGGVGSRFWPLSRLEKPKQFLDILGIGKTLLQQTFDRFKKVCPVENILVVTSVIYKDLVLSQLPEILETNVLLEPNRRNTAPCIAYANHKIKIQNVNANIVVSPSDHLILDEVEFLKAINSGLDFTLKNNVLLTLGIKPNRPETGYGYIQVSSDSVDEIIKNTDFRKVKTFTEKPEYEMAKIFFESGEFFWNSGIFIWSLNCINNAFEKSLNDVNSLFLTSKDYFNTNQEMQFIEKVYSECQSISIDYGVMERADNVFVLPSDFGWSDLGTWGSLYESIDKDENRNAIKGNNVMVYNTKNSIINVPDNKLVVIQGLEDVIVAESEDILLVSTIKGEQFIRQIVNEVKIEKGDKFI